MIRKKKNLPLHVSLQRIKAERVNVVKRTKDRIAMLHTKEKDQNEDDKPWSDFLCGNHTRNLPLDEFNKVA
jgi:hypothetical protein